MKGVCARDTAILTRDNAFDFENFIFITKIKTALMS